MSLIVVGDIHGHLPALEDLLPKIESASPEEVVFLGDYIDRGPDSRGCVERVIDFRDQTKSEVTCLMGNHEDWMLRSYHDPTKHSWLIGMEAETIASYSTRADDLIPSELEQAGLKLFTDKAELPYHLFFDAMPQDHLECFLSLKLYHHWHDVICAHGGLDPTRGPVERQTREALLWGTDSFPKDFTGDELIVYGHWNDFVVDSDGTPQPKFTDSRAVCIDTISQGVLTAMRFPDRHVIQSKST